jgi:hypothetical protein
LNAIKAIAASDEAAGYVLVPREATDDMTAAAFIAWAESMEGPIAQMLRIQNAVNAAIAAAKDDGNEAER